MPAKELPTADMFMARWLLANVKSTPGARLLAAPDIMMDVRYFVFFYTFRDWMRVYTGDLNSPLISRLRDEAVAMTWRFYTHNHATVFKVKPVYTPVELPVRVT